MLKIYLKKIMAFSVLRACNDLIVADTDTASLYQSTDSYLPKPIPLTSELQDALAMFLFCFHARLMSFVDMAYFTKSNIKKGTIRYFRKKTGQLSEVKNHSNDAPYNRPFRESNMA